MIEVLKQALDALETEVSIDWTNNDEFNASAEKMHDAITSLRQAIAELESQEPVLYWSFRVEYALLPSNYDVEDNPTHVPLYRHPPQRKPLTDGDFLDWYDSAIWGNEDFKQCCQIAFEAGWQFAHSIKE